MQKARLHFYLLILAIVFGLGAIDVADDYRQGSGSVHLLLEIALLVACLALMQRLWLAYRQQSREVAELTTSRNALNESIAHWKEETRSLQSTIRQGILEEFKKWNLSRSEIEVAFLTLRGYSFIQIGSLLNKSERTVRKQAGSVYEKSGCTGRIEFVGYFLESIFKLEDEESF
jgi:DNA-binding CsgD family transcriptional regulator